MKQLRAILLLPGIVTLVIPAVILFSTGPIRLGGPLSRPWKAAAVVFGGVFILAGLALMVQTIRLFVREGRGTLAPWDPAQKLVVRGVYRYMRNPMIGGVFCVLLGEALLFASLPLLAWFGLCVLINLAYIPLLEEPGLERRFGPGYSAYRDNVPRWIPHRSPWEPPGDDNPGP